MCMTCCRRARLNSQGAMLMCLATDSRSGLAESEGGVETLVHALVLCWASMVPCSDHGNRFPALCWAAAVARAWLLCCLWYDMRAARDIS